VIAALSFQVSVLRSELLEGEESPNTKRAASPLTAGRSREFQISNFTFEVSEENPSDDDKCNREETSQPGFRF
jgi:hypothetical protein